MSIELRCPACEKLLRVPTDAAGKRAKCPACQATVQIPYPAEEREPPLDAPADIPSAASSGAATPAASAPPYPAGPQGDDRSPAEVAARNLLEKEISSQATTSLVVGIISFFCFGIILAPFAIYRGHKALRLIAEHGVGQRYSGTANAGKVIGIVSLCLNVGVVLLWMLLVCGGVLAEM